MPFDRAKVSIMFGTNMNPSVICAVVFGFV